MNSMNAVEDDAGRAGVNETLHVQLHASIDDILGPFTKKPKDLSRMDSNLQKSEVFIYLAH